MTGENHSMIDPSDRSDRSHSSIDRSRRDIDRVGRSPSGRPRDRMGVGMDADARTRTRPRPRTVRTTRRAFVAVSVMVAFATTACVGGRASVDTDDASSSSSSSSSSESSFESSFVRALDVETLRDDVIARSRDPWVISFSGSRERCGMCGTMDDAFARAAKIAARRFGATVKFARVDATAENVDVEALGRTVGLTTIPAVKGYPTHATLNPYDARRSVKMPKTFETTDRSRDRDRPRVSARGVVRDDGMGATTARMKTDDDDGRVVRAWNRALRLRRRNARPVTRAPPSPVRRRRRTSRFEGARVSRALSLSTSRTRAGVRADAKDVDARGKTGGNDDAERWMDGCVSDDGCASRGEDGGMEELDARRRTTTTRFKRRRLTNDDDEWRAGDPARLATCTSSA